MGSARLLLLALAIIAFFYTARRLKGILLPALVLIGTGFALFMVDLILRSFFGSGFLFETSSDSSTAFISLIASYVGQIVGLILLLFGFYRVNRVVIDITERQRIEDEQRIISQALEESEKRYRKFFEEDLAGDFIATPDAHILACNPSFAKMLGYSSVFEIMNSDGLGLYESPRAYENFLEVLRKHRSLSNYQMVMRRRDDSPVYVVGNISAEFNEQDELIKIQGFVIDESERVRVEQTLRTSVEQFRKVFEEGPVGMMMVTLQGEIIKVNNAFCAMVGYPETELRRLTIDGVTHPDDVRKDLERMQLLLSGEIATYRTEKRFMTKRGDVIWGLLTASVVKEADGTPLYGLRIVEDITARKRGEEELEQSLSVLRATFEATPASIMVVDLQGRLINYNLRVVDMWGIPQDLLMDRDEKKIINFMLKQVEDRESFLSTIKGAYAHPEVESFDVVRLTDGRVIERYSKPQRVAGKTVGKVWAFLDSTERIRSEERIRASEEKYRTLFEESKDVVFISTPGGRFLDINQAGVELFGYSSKEELLSADISRDLYTVPVDREKAHRVLEREGYIKDHPTVARTKDGRSLVVLETTTTVRGPTGEVIAYRGILRDVTEQRRLEDQLRQVQRMESVGTLAGGIAHDFNNILSIAVGYLARLDGPDVSQEAKAHTLESIRKALARGTGLVQQLLTFARKTSGVFEAVWVNEVIRDFTKLLSDTFPPNIHFELDLDENLPLLLADAGQLQQAMLNLCINARDAIMEQESFERLGGTVSIDSSVVDRDALIERFPTAKEDRYVLIRVRDTGSGMDESTKGRIFEPFFTTKPQGKGTGLGLAVVYGVVNGHQGFVDVDSARGKGTAISLYFPVQPVEAPVAPDKSMIEPPRGAGQTVLVVEDEEMLLDLLETLLEEQGYRVLTARDGQEAVDIYRQFGDGISIVLSDMGLPKLGGWEVFRQMKEMNPKVRCILASGYFDPDLRVQMVKEGAVDFVQKPYVPNVILARIGEVINNFVPSEQGSKS
ncbi:MAG: PAS domain S-box protein [Ignavibacteriales bacterium]|nr:PAS domain S-box protein [Ignavibacteriales bacterium]